MMYNAYSPYYSHDDYSSEDDSSWVSQADIYGQGSVSGVSGGYSVDPVNSIIYNQTLPLGRKYGLFADYVQPLYPNNEQNQVPQYVAQNIPPLVLPNSGNLLQSTYSPSYSYSSYPVYSQTSSYKPRVIGEYIEVLDNESQLEDYIEFKDLASKRTTKRVIRLLRRTESSDNEEEDEQNSKSNQPNGDEKRNKRKDRKKRNSRTKHHSRKSHSSAHADDE